MSLLVADGRQMAARYRPLRAFGLASVMITQLCDRVEELERELRDCRAELERLTPEKEKPDDNALLDALEEIGRSLS